MGLLLQKGSWHMVAYKIYQQSHLEFLPTWCMLKKEPPDSASNLLEALQLLLCYFPRKSEQLETGYFASPSSCSEQVS